LKKYILCSLVLGASFTSVVAQADGEIKLKKSCLKDYPEVVGENNPELLIIYSQLCDKKNKDNKNSNLVLAAQKFQQIGRNDKAIQIVNYLEGQNFQNTDLTDVKFLAGIGLAYDALNKMQNSEMRYLTENGTYPIAKNFADALKKATPSSILVEKQQEAPVKPKVIRTPVKQKRPQTPSRTSSQPTPKPAVTPAKPKQQSAPTGQNPFGKL